MASATFSWDIEPSHTEYDVTYRDVTNSGSVIAVPPPVVPPDNSKTITGLLDDTEYEFCVRAYCNSDSGFSDWSCIRSTTPAVPKFRLSARIYSPLGFIGPSHILNVRTSANTIKVSANSTTTYHQVILPMSDFTDEIFLPEISFSSSKCQAIYLFKNGVLMHGIMYNLSSGNITPSFHTPDLVHAFNLAEDDIIDFVFIIDSGDSTSGDPYVHPNYISVCSNINPMTSI